MSLKLVSESVKYGNIHLYLPSPKKPKKYTKEVKRGKSVARMIALKQGTCLAREMVNYMVEEGSLIPGEHEHEHWVSAVFAKSTEWRWTGKWGTNNVPSFNTQGGPRGTKVWELVNPFYSQLLMDMEQNEWH